MHSYMKIFGEQNGRWKHPAVGCRFVSLHFKRMYLFEFTVTCGMTCCRLGAWPLLTSPRTAEPMLMADDAHPKPQQWGAVDGRNPSSVEVGSLSHYLQGFIHARWLALGLLNHQQYVQDKEFSGKTTGTLTLSCFCEMLQKIRILARKIFADLSCENGTCLFPQVFTLWAEIHNLDSLIIQQTTQIDHKWEKEILNLDNESSL